jgi:hypothetical protein
MSALFLSAHCEGATQASGHDVGGPRGAWAVANQILSVGFPWRWGRALNTPNRCFLLYARSPSIATQVWIIRAWTFQWSLQWDNIDPKEELLEMSVLHELLRVGHFWFGHLDASSRVSTCGPIEKTDNSFRILQVQSAVYNRGMNVQELQKFGQPLARAVN